MAKAKKITEAELEAVRTAVTNFNRAKANLGELEYQKSQVVTQIVSLEAALKEEQQVLEKTYGSVTVNLETGEYEEAVEEAEEVK